MTTFHTRYEIPGIVGVSCITPTERESVLSLIEPMARVLEIGTFQGATCAYWAKARPQAAFVCVDTFMWGDGRSIETVRAAWEANRQPNMRLVVGTSADLLRNGELYDLAFIDADHSYASCRNDLSAAKRLITPGGTICCHDYETGDPQLEGVTRAVNEYAAHSRVAILRIAESLAVMRHV